MQHSLFHGQMQNGHQRKHLLPNVDLRNVVLNNVINCGTTFVDYNFASQEFFVCYRCSLHFFAVNKRCNDRRCGTSAGLCNKASFKTCPKPQQANYAIRCGSPVCTAAKGRRAAGSDSHTDLTGAGLIKLFSAKISKLSKTY